MFIKCNKYFLRFHYSRFVFIDFDVNDQYLSVVVVTNKQIKQPGESEAAPIQGPPEEAPTEAPDGVPEKVPVTKTIASE